MSVDLQSKVDALHLYLARPSNMDKRPVAVAALLAVEKELGRLRTIEYCARCLVERYEHGDFVDSDVTASERALVKALEVKP